MPLVAQGFQKATMFFSFGMARRFMLEQNAARAGPPGGPQLVAPGPLPLWQLFLCGSFAGVANSVVANPFELVRNRLQVQYARHAADAQYRGPIDAALQIARGPGGVRSLWLGLGPMMLRDAPGLGAWYGTFEASRRFLLPPGSDPAKAPKSVTVASGALAGVAFWTFGMAQDTVKNVIQTQGMSMAMEGAAAAATASKSGAAASAPIAVSGFWATGARLVRQEGWSRLWRGFPIAAARGIPGASSTFLTYQLVRGEREERTEHAADASGRQARDAKRIAHQVYVFSLLFLCMCR